MEYAIQNTGNGDFGTPFLDVLVSNSPRLSEKSSFSSYHTHTKPFSPKHGKNLHYISSPDTLGDEGFSDECFEYINSSSDESNDYKPAVKGPSKLASEKNSGSADIFFNYDPTMSDLCINKNQELGHSLGHYPALIFPNIDSLDSISSQLDRFVYLKSRGLVSRPKNDPLAPPGYEDFRVFGSSPKISHLKARRYSSKYSPSYPTSPRPVPKSVSFSPKSPSSKNYSPRFEPKLSQKSPLSPSSKKSPLRIPAIMFNLNKSSPEDSTQTKRSPSQGVRNQEAALKSLKTMIESLKTISYPNKKYAR
ncbi:hypothetical protein AYI68_g5292 [Smittium mucronatum]|uniref:Uncharacterized protein n=1 Tax=Smittium mucronatum TaxID=133383 RepID=A0A1R0GUP8_9FUNG|nr:hypothetical protein AYI68_g5292 [Smittium mucronatum]